jgi:AraC family transcriptional regulator, arabinose operon regulatory protein
MPGPAAKLHNIATAFELGASPPPNLLVTGHFRAGQAYHVVRPQGSPNWYASLTLRGQGSYRQGGIERQANPADLVLLSPRTPHDYGVFAGGTWELIWAHFNPRAAWLSWLRLPEVGDGLFALSFRSPGTFQRARRAMLRLHGDICEALGLPKDFIRKAPEPDPYHEYLAELDAIQFDLAMSGLEEVLLLAMRESNLQSPRSLDSRVQQVLDILASDPNGRHDIHEFARAVMLSPSRLAHLFKHETGETISNTLLEQRMRRAALLLEATDLSIGAVAEQLGYSSLYYFSRQFHYHFGVSPRAYREALENAGSRLSARPQ